MNNYRILLYFLTFCSTSAAYSFPCYFTFVKGDCWKEYHVAIEVIDAVSEKTLATIAVPKGKLWERTTFTCQPKQKLYYKATFSPTIWTGDEHKVYRTKQFNYLPEEIQPKEAAWNIQSCYPQEFAEVPIPPKSTGNCSCDFSTIPEIKPIKAP